MKSLASAAAAAAITLAFTVPAFADGPGYEVWASDQSNSVAGASGPGRNGSFLWIWDSDDIEAQLAGGPDAQPLPCRPGQRKAKGKKRGKAKVAPAAGPCELWDVFPPDLLEVDADGNLTGNRLGDLNDFGRLHGMLPDPQQMYVTANIFAPSGGYVGIIDVRRKEAVALFRVTATDSNSVQRSVHMSFFDETGDSIIVANLHGKVLERIDLTRNGAGKIKRAVFNRSASLGVGKGQSVIAGATAFRGVGGHGKPLLGHVGGDYADADFSDLTPNGECKENGCGTGPDALSGGRPNNVIICPIPSDAGLAYVTMGGGGLLVADTSATPMRIKGEYGNEVVNGAGCGGGQLGTEMWLNAGVSASGAGATQSTFTLYTLDDTAFGSVNPPNTPAPFEVFKDAGNTATIGNFLGDPNPNTTGQLPGVTTRRDAHGVAVTRGETHIHNVDRIQNTVEVFDGVTYARTTYDLTSADGQGGGAGPCAAKSVNDDPGLPQNDPAPDLLERTPDGRYLMVAFRGPRPVSVGHSAQGSCPGVGVVELLDGGASGRLVGVLRTTNTVDDTQASAPGGYAYSGAEHSDVHAATVISKRPRRRRR